MSFPKEGNHQIAIVTGGHQAKPSPAKDGTCQIYDPGRHGPSINPDNFPFISMMKPPFQQCLEETSWAPEPGTCIFYTSDNGVGDPSSYRLVGLAGNEKNDRQSVPGNMNLAEFLRALQEAFQQKTGKNYHDGYRTENRGGAEVRVPKVMEEWYHDLTKGLPSHAAMAPLGGTIIPQIKKIDTAVQQATNILDSSVLSKLPGQFMSLKNLFSSLSKQQKSRATQNMPPEVLQGFESMSKLLQSSDGGDGSALTSMRVDPDTFMENATELLSQAKTLPDLLSAVQRLQYDETLRGMDKLKDTEIEVETPFGKITQTISPSGNVTSKIPDAVQKAQQAFGKLLSGASSYPGANGALDHFAGKSAKITELISRLPGNKQALLKNALQNPAAFGASFVHGKNLKELLSGNVPILEAAGKLLRTIKG